MTLLRLFKYHNVLKRWKICGALPKSVYQFDQASKYIDLFTTRHKVVHNDGPPNFKGSLFNKNTTYMAQFLQSLSYKVCSIILPKFNTFGLFIPILGTSTIMDQTACCYDVTTSEIGLYEFHQFPLFFLLFPDYSFVSLKSDMLFNKFSKTLILFHEIFSLICSFIYKRGSRIIWLLLGKGLKWKVGFPQAKTFHPDGKTNGKVLK